MKVLYTNVDVLTDAKMMELKTLVDQTQPKIIGVVEVKPKNFRRTLPPRNTVSPIITLNFMVLVLRTVEEGLRYIGLYTQILIIHKGRDIISR